MAKTQKNGMRYKAEWLLECLLLRINIKATYEHLRRRKLIPLPHRATLGRLLAGMSCHFGFNKFALDEIEMALEGKSEENRLVVLSFDEVSITPSLKFNSETLEFDGFVNHGNDPLLNREELFNNRREDAENDIEPVLGESPKLADHALVYMIRPFKDNWIMPFVEWLEFSRRMALYQEMTYTGC